MCNCNDWKNQCFDFLQGQKAQSWRSLEIKGLAGIHTRGGLASSFGEWCYIWGIWVWKEEATYGLQIAFLRTERHKVLPNLLSRVINTNESWELLILVNHFTQHWVCLFELCNFP